MTKVAKIDTLFTTYMYKQNGLRTISFGETRTYIAEDV